MGIAEAVQGVKGCDGLTRFPHALADKLRATGMITSEAVDQAFRVVPRHQFVPADTPLEAVYNPDESVVVKRDERGRAISTISAPFLQARMIEQAELRPGMRVLEIGSGGYNAALLAEVVGPSGWVVSVDIDPEVTDQARAALAQTGYGHRVRVVLADAEHGLPESEPFDRIIVTVGAWDIPPTWLDLLTSDGMLVVPLRMNGVTRSIAFRRQADHLVSTSADVCGFVPIQGQGQHAERHITLTNPDGRTVTLRFEDGAPDDPAALNEALSAGGTAVWSGVTIRNQTSFADMYLWFACFLPGFCKITAEKSSDLAEQTGKWFPYGAAHGDSFSYLAVRPALEGAGVEFGAAAYGRHAEAAASALVAQIQAWDRQARPGPTPTFRYWPAGSDHRQLHENAAVLHKAHGLVTVSWPAVE